jgi:hypothetical protein
MKVLEGTTGSPGQNGLGVVSVPTPFGLPASGPGVGSAQGPTAGDVVNLGDGQGEEALPDDGDYVVDIYMQHEQEEQDTANEDTAKSADPRPHVPVVQVDGYVPPPTLCPILFFSFISEANNMLMTR